MDGTRGTGVVGPAPGVTGEVDRGRRRAVVGPVGCKYLRPSIVQARHPYCVLDGLRATCREKHVVKPLRGNLDDHPRSLAANVRGVAGRKHT
jgi:hypothetical protein